MTATSGPGDLKVADVELWVRDLTATAGLLHDLFDFRSYANVRSATDEPRRPGPGTDSSDQDLALVGGAVNLVLRQASSTDSPVARHVRHHGDSVGDVVLACSDPNAVVERAVAFGLDVFGLDERPTIDVLGERTLCHSLVAATCQATTPIGSPDPVTTGLPGPGGMLGIDHVAYCVPWGDAERAARAYETVFGMDRLEARDVRDADRSAGGMNSVVVRSGSGFTAVLTEPSTPDGPGQIQRFLDAHGGAGVQHLALAYSDLVSAVAWLRSRGVEFLSVPDKYFDQAERRLGGLALPWDKLRRMAILVDCDADGILFQLFTRPLLTRHTLFFELVQRDGATGFGANNVAALFASVEAATSNYSP